MGLKKRSKVSAEFSMSSLTDIIFLLLIFFMLTSSLVAPNALNLKLPGTTKSKPSSSSKLDKVYISSRSTYRLNGDDMSLSTLEASLRRKALRAGSRQLDIIIEPSKGAPVEAVVAIMDIAMRFDINGILSAEK